MRIPLRRTILGALLAIGVAVPVAAEPAADTVAAIRAKGHVACGVTPSAADARTRSAWTGFEVDYCRALASVILGDADKIRLVGVSAGRRLTALEQGEFDILPHATTWTLEREAGGNVAFAVTTYYDGQSFILRSDQGIRRIQQMDGLKVCVETATTTEQNVIDYARAMRLRLTIVPTPDAATAEAAFLGGFCDALTSDQSDLAAFRKLQGRRADQFTLLGEIISKEPLSIVVRRGDWRFFNIVRWTHFAMVAAEELNMDSRTVQELRARSENDLSTTSLDVQRMLGRIGSSGKMLGVDPDWAARLVMQVGNYREVWERNIGPLGLRRGLNLLWNQGGLQYAPPMR